MTDESLLIDAPPDDLNDVHDYLERVFFSHPEVNEKDRMEFETAVIELAGNVIQHAVTGSSVRAVLVVTVEPEYLAGCISDSSDAVRSVLGKTDMPDESAESGRGIPFIRALVDGLQYERRNDRNYWRIQKRISV